MGNAQIQIDKDELNGFVEDDRKFNYLVFRVGAIFYGGANDFVAAFSTLPEAVRYCHDNRIHGHVADLNHNLEIVQEFFFGN